MKTLAVTIALLVLAGCQPKETVETTTVKTASMVCSKCAKTIEHAVAAVKGVQNVQADVKSKTVEVRFSPAETNLGAIEQAITGAGYDANSRKRDPGAYAKLDACCKIDG